MVPIKGTLRASIDYWESATKETPASTNTKASPMDLKPRLRNRSRDQSRDQNQVLKATPPSQVGHHRLATRIRLKRRRPASSSSKGDASTATNADTSTPTPRRRLSQKASPNRKASRKPNQKEHQQENLQCLPYQPWQRVRQEERGIHPYPIVLQATKWLHVASCATPDASMT